MRFIRIAGKFLDFLRPPPQDSLHIEGIVRIYALPEDLADEAAYKRWWATFSESEKERFSTLKGEFRNIITSAGRTQVLTFMGNTGTTTAFAQQFAVGTGAISKVDAADNALAGELYRNAPSSYSVVGNAVTVSTLIDASHGIGTWSNCGFFGNGATSTSGSGTLMTHLLSYHTHTATAETADYTMSLT